MFRVIPLRALVLTWLAFCCNACSLIHETFPDKRVEYEKATSLPALEIPPGLATPAADEELIIPKGRSRESVSYSGYNASADIAPQQSTHDNVLPVQENIKVVREGNKRWLVAHGTPDQLWSKVHSFWLDQGFLIKQEDPRNGLIETDWLENRANIPQTGIRYLFGKVMDGLYDSSTRDRFRVRLERGETPNITEIYISHLGAEEVVQGDNAIWQTRPNDPELEAIMLQRLMVFMGIQTKKADTMMATSGSMNEHAHLTIQDRTTSLKVDEDFQRAWRHTGLALDRVGFTVVDRDRSKGIYYVRYNDPMKEDEKKKKGFLDKLAFWRSDAPPNTEEYQIQLKDQQERTEIAVFNKAGAVDESPIGRRILTLLHEQLK